MKKKEEAINLFAGLEIEVTRLFESYKKRVDMNYEVII